MQNINRDFGFLLFASENDAVLMAGRSSNPKPKTRDIPKWDGKTMTLLEVHPEGLRGTMSGWT